MILLCFVRASPRVALRRRPAAHRRRWDIGITHAFDLFPVRNSDTGCGAGVLLAWDVAPGRVFPIGNRLVGGDRFGGHAAGGEERSGERGEEQSVHGRHGALVGKGTRMITDRRALWRLP